MALHSIFDAGVLRRELESTGISDQFVPVIWKYVLQNPKCKVDDVPSLPSSAYPILRSKFRTMTSTLASAVESKDCVTTKLLINLQEDDVFLRFERSYLEVSFRRWSPEVNGTSVEAVIMRYDTRLGKYDGKPRPGGPRSTLCVSSQVGCKMGCKFCATGSMGFKKNLTSGEIVEQLVHASRFSQIRNIVFMGMGEPLNNYAAVVEAIHVMTGLPFQLSPKRITVSTVGIIHSINKLRDDLPGVNLAVSLHAPDQDIRCQIMPAARAFPLWKLMDTLLEYQKKCQQKIFIEYIMLDGVNDSEQHAHQLGKLLEMFKVVVNLIPFNPTDTSSSFQTSVHQNVTTFQKTLRGIYNIRTTIRQEMGQDISGACGQLVLNLHKERSIGDATNLLTDIEDIRI